MINTVIAVFVTPFALCACAYLLIDWEFLRSLGIAKRAKKAGHKLLNDRAETYVLGLENKIK